MSSSHGGGTDERDTVVRRVLLRSSAFVRAAKRLIKKHPDAAEDLRDALELLSEDAFHAKLKTHGLKGDMKGLWACSVDYDSRILFKFVQHEGAEAILLQTVGSHDEVY
ncbi:MAG: type II toxin-antitoxin system mRNA interferase toxin, RelE/StbE family [Deltaproteobacteria bacterium]|nr:type II toxin-antitoxin system mRNA interferase toxin, RelE/StbE family [Deltaproteobacteria bacterium]